MRLIWRNKVLPSGQRPNQREKIKTLTALQRHPSVGPAFRPADVWPKNPDTTAPCQRVIETFRRSAIHVSIMNPKWTGADSATHLPISSFQFRSELVLRCLNAPATDRSQMVHINIMRHRKSRWSWLLPRYNIYTRTNRQTDRHTPTHPRGYTDAVPFRRLLLNYPTGPTASFHLLSTRKVDHITISRIELHIQPSTSSNSAPFHLLQWKMTRTGHWVFLLIDRFLQDLDRKNLWSSVNAINFDNDGIWHWFLEQVTE